MAEIRNFRTFCRGESDLLVDLIRGRVRATSVMQNFHVVVHGGPGPNCAVTVRLEPLTLPLHIRINTTPGIRHQHASSVGLPPAHADPSEMESSSDLGAFTCLHPQKFKSDEIPIATSALSPTVVLQT